MLLVQLRERIIEATYADEHSSVTKLLSGLALNPQQRADVLEKSKKLVKLCREDKHGKGTLDSFLEEFGLSNKEGVALMCLAEALLRVPDSRTADRLISEKILSGNWSEHQGKSDSVFVNASTWGLMLTGAVVELPREYRERPGNAVKHLISRLGEPIVRAGVLQAMRIMGGQYVLGRSIGEAVKRGRKQNTRATRFSFDMLGEGARTESDALRYFESYASAIREIGSGNTLAEPVTADGISVKLSALHPRYHYSHREAVLQSLLPRIRELCVLAARYNIGLSIDAEESERLELSLDIFEALARDEELTAWQGLGLVLQTYQKRAPYVVDWLVELARETGRRIPVRLVKGAYWDAEIKRAQELGMPEYPVFTRKANTDACYLHCAEKVLKEPQRIFPQFATHNAYTAAMVLELAGDAEFEFQRLHGMGHILYKHLVQLCPHRDVAVRVYAPVGSHKDLLPYLVRRLLENGANSSFVNRFLDDDVPVDELLEDVYEQVQAVPVYRHSGIPRPPDLFSSQPDQRSNSRGFDLELSTHADTLLAQVNTAAPECIHAGALVDGETTLASPVRVASPADHSCTVGWVSDASQDTALRALASADGGQGAWNALGAARRAEILGDVAQRYEDNYLELVSLLSREAGRTLNDCVAEVREAIDFCRYYANQAMQTMGEGSGLQGRGTFLCISPWNFPLAIFTGQVAAALVTGNAVLAKPAEQTPLIAFRAVQLFHQAGVPTAVLHLLPGDGASLGSVLLNDSRVTGVAFTGSTATASLINRQVAQRPGRGISLIAETGGQNCMIADSTALPEQLVDDVIESAFSSAGQRCSALRVLFIQADIADQVIEMLRGALLCRHIGEPWLLSTDFGPVIDQDAQRMLLAHIEMMKQKAHLLGNLNADTPDLQGTYVAPHIFEIDSLEQLDGEVFGPVLHVVRYKAEEIDAVIDSINQTGFGLTLGVHSRIEAFARYVFAHTLAGNTYVNRNMVGAVVGVNPFGGTGLSGTGPKAGGPHYLYRFTRPAVTAGPVPDPVSVQLAAGGDHSDSVDAQLQAAHRAHLSWRARPGQVRADVLRHCVHVLSTGGAAVFEQLAQLAEGAISEPLVMPGPTGEEDTLMLTGKGVVACLATEPDSADTIAVQVGLAMAAGCAAVLADGAAHDAIIQALRRCLAECSVDENLVCSVAPGDARQVLTSKAVVAATVNGRVAESSSLRVLLASRKGPLVPLVEVPGGQGLSRAADWLCMLIPLMVERTFTDNLVAKGGNTQLFNLHEDALPGPAGLSA
ncbi:bifunctional proline dehydrogenase/L-glutamate gamma-semialdehyde dehydrogenase PutA [Pseudohalioglobus lutimaris]|uniref:Bifunctional protein PutA n=1 Tax=Pseudohalioglobus lutimaris TaxID=1737061 RepID=A0A2N5X575_9GAMM|nr:bifunctional proline dehydrogenase/L-glutamate gamma-semialdehyde dehydrogenase PutA [Pseudohalioglobus lutimaris]PLW69645.1 bifunctional proline dehydrogenase/L-glutamate gamma-semialdehyde dehydrogenase [Pseudohalioglobus lutimaris]